MPRIASRHHVDWAEHLLCQLWDCERPVALAVASRQGGKAWRRKDTEVIIGLAVPSFTCYSAPFGLRVMLFSFHYNWTIQSFRPIHQQGIC